MKRLHRLFGFLLALCLLCGAPLSAVSMADAKPEEALAEGLPPEGDGEREAPLQEGASPDEAKSVPSPEPVLPQEEAPASQAEPALLSLPQEASPAWGDAARVALYGGEGQAGSIPYLIAGARKNALTVGTTGGEWSMLCLARALGGGDDPSCDDVRAAYLENAKQVIEAADGALHSRKYTEYSRVILAWTALGGDARDVAGYDFIEKLSDFYWANWQGINGTIFALIAADTKNYAFSTAEELSAAGVALRDGASTRQRLISRILELEITDEEGARGGWALSGSTPDPDVTGMALQALAPYASEQPEVAAAIERALAALRTLQREDGGFAGWESANVESCVQVLTALCTLGMDPLDEENGFVREGGNLVEAILRFRCSDNSGAFCHTGNAQADGMATDQATYGLIAYERFLSGAPPLYDMRDAEAPQEDEPGAVRLNGTALNAAAIDEALFQSGKNVLTFALSDGSVRTFTFDYAPEDRAELRLAAKNNAATLRCDAGVLPSGCALQYEELEENSKTFQRFREAFAEFEELSGSVRSAGRLTAALDGAAQEPYGTVTIGLPLPARYGRLVPKIAALDKKSGLVFFDTTAANGFATAKVGTLDAAYAVVMLSADSVTELSNATDTTDYDALESKIGKADEGDTVTLKISSKTQVPWSVFEALHNAEPNVSLRFYSSRYGTYWTFRSDDIKDTLPSSSYFDPWIVLSEKDAAAAAAFPEQAFLCVAPRGEGKLPGRSTLLFSRPESLEKSGALALWSLAGDGAPTDATGRFAENDSQCAITLTGMGRYVVAAAGGIGTSPAAKSAEDAQGGASLTPELPAKPLDPPQEEAETTDGSAALRAAFLADYQESRAALERFVAEGAENQQALRQALFDLREQSAAAAESAARATALFCCAAAAAGALGCFGIQRLLKKGKGKNHETEK